MSIHSIFSAFTLTGLVFIATSSPEVAIYDNLVGGDSYDALVGIGMLPGDLPVPNLPSVFQAEGFTPIGTAFSLDKIELTVALLNNSDPNDLSVSMRSNTTVVVSGRIFDFPGAPLGDRL